ncbi:substrate-binding periplasmic protein [Spartinivicinus marinus]|uniref:substrate-binding periplasmic protein n=1 Tax=Spartinivicinus marinus TaxID=2994442 RepID=UPI00225877F4|nr:transporter substrate-binding domain-containing protein [Spartinivicinus marinus]MCX4030329.1 hypothetical protein [Spartinivicinus marinus]
MYGFFYKANKYMIISLLLFYSHAFGSSNSIMQITADLPPFTVEDSKEQRGFLYEIVGLMHQHANLPYKPRFSPWPRAQKTAREKNNYLIFGLTRTKNREPNYLWIVNLLSIEVSFVMITGSPPKTLVEAKRLSISVARETPWSRFLNKNNFKRIQLVTKEIQNARMLIYNRVDAWYVPTVRAFYLLKKEDITTIL